MNDTEPMAALTPGATLPSANASYEPNAGGSQQSADPQPGTDPDSP